MDRDEIIRENVFEVLDKQDDVSLYDYVWVALMFGIEETEARQLIEEWIRERWPQVAEETLTWNFWGL